MIIYSEQSTFADSGKDFEQTVKGQGYINTGKDLTVKVDSNADINVTNSLEFKARDIVGKAQNDFSEYSVSHTIKAQNAIKINATTSIDIKALMIKEN